MKKVLVANRGEIAIRIMKTLKKMEIQSVAVYSDADKDALHVKFADEAAYIGESPSSKSYLDAKKLIEISKNLGVEGIHPGYGFLSENADFARLVENSGITFIGPSADSIDIMGSKLAAKKAVKDFDVPLVPGTEGAIEDYQEAINIAKEIGFPVLIKASAGGGGKGMRVVENESELHEQMDRAISEAKSAFGNGSVFIEKYVSSPRHIEVQILGDKHGNIIHLFERECSIQRRHQKVIEEAPSAILNDEERKKIGEAAVQVAKSCNYFGAGTVEFILDEKKNFYFLEMNTRLQVEHPVTELITGIDLVEQQLRVARGEKLGFKQADIHINGHAIETRVYAEDPFNDFLPSIGTLTKYRKPTGENIRLDDAYQEKMQIPIFYDPMIAKLITWGKDRNEAIATMKAAINGYLIEGIETTLVFAAFVMNHPAFVDGEFNTHFVQKHFTSTDAKRYNQSLAYQAAVLTLAKWLEDNSNLEISNNPTSKWSER